jgi:hypothetical protein
VQPGVLETIKVKTNPEGVEHHAEKQKKKD